MKKRELETSKELAERAVDLLFQAIEKTNDDGGGSEADDSFAIAHDLISIWNIDERRLNAKRHLREYRTKKYESDKLEELVRKLRKLLDK